MTDNVYMQEVDALDADISDKAMLEWRQLLTKLAAHGVEILEFEATDPRLIDAVFPDWIVTIRDENYPDGLLLVFPMRHMSRRNERKPEIINRLRQDYATVVDLSAYEEEGLFLEGNGCLRYVRKSKTFYLNLSGRAHLKVAEDMLSQLNSRALPGCSYSLYTFGSVDPTGRSVFHTDLLLGLTHTEAFICKECIKPDDYPGLEQALKDEGFVIKEITYEQVTFFSCNFILSWSQVLSSPIIFISRKACPVDTEFAVEYIDAPTIESLGGGSVHCMLVELW